MISRENRIKKSILETRRYMTKPFAFFFHYNKPASLTSGEPTISLHFKNKCHMIQELYCEVSTHSRINKNNSPHFVMAGNANKITFSDDKSIAYIW